jgi:hypothetical protein
MVTDSGPKRTAMRRTLWISLTALALLSGCATTPYRVHPQFEGRLRTGLTVALLPPDVKVFQLTAGEVTEQMDEWSETAQRNVEAAIRKRLGSIRVLTVHEFDPAKVQTAREEFEDANPLFRAVALSAVLHTYRPETQFKTKMDRFDYSLGPLPALAEASEADALLFVTALDHISTGGRVARNIALVLIGAAAGVVVIPAGGATVMAAALVDARTGDILWFNRHATGGGHDLRDPASADAFVAQAFEAFSKTFPTGKPEMEKRP